MDRRELNQELVDFIRKSASMFHTIATIKGLLNDAGFEEWREEEDWAPQPKGKYYTTRNGSSLIAFTVGSDLDALAFRMTAAHSDSPTFKVKSVPELKGPGEYLRLNVEAYGGMIDSTWLDRPLGLAGRVLVKTDGGVESRLFNSEKDILLIPNVPVHMNRGVNDGYAFNRQVDLLPLFSAGEMENGALDAMLAEALGVAASDILAKDLFLVNHEAPSIWGVKDEFVSTPKLDDLQCVFVSLKAFLASENDRGVNVFVCFDNEEVGSNTKQGAMSTFLKDALRRLTLGLGKSEQEFHQAVSRSFLVSCDNAHAVHPNHPELCDDENRTYLNKGIVIKEAANQKYTSDAFSQAVFLSVCEKAGVPVQHFANRSNMQGGSTLGNLSNTQISVHAVDIGLPQLAMHSSYETAGCQDTVDAVKALTTFFNAALEIHGAESFRLDA
ncbi:MAG: M18 family aminopeptidase [Peptoniphilaceae bacterium]|nr:M18 family aminopeptidase [Peptoniphilaceae bacterium]MDY6085142.1 M18 family aminopeptidase [Peptoniphilaceae bacterium]